MSTFDFERSIQLKRHVDRLQEVKVGTGGGIKKRERGSREVESA
jgi:hypothetical protein